MSDGGGSGAAPASGPVFEKRRAARLVPALTRYWALLGGLILIALVLLTAASALTNLFLHKPVPGDYELVKHFVAVAVFAFLPYCQVTHANVTVDIFTEGMSDRAKAAMLLLSSVLAIVFALILLRQMSLGFRDYLRYPEMTATLHLPLWTAFPPMLVSLVLLLAASIVTAMEGVRGMRAPPQPA